MPTYDYLCPDCGHVFEIFEKIADDHPKACGKCGRRRARRKISAPAGLIFKGGGFYVTDYKNGGTNGDAKKKTARKTTDKAEKPKPDKTEKK